MPSFSVSTVRADGRALLGAVTSTYLPLDKMAAILAGDIFNCISWMKRFEFWLEFHWSLFLGVQFQHWFS